MIFYEVFENRYYHNEEQIYSELMIPPKYVHISISTNSPIIIHNRKYQFITKQNPFKENYKEA